jgi:predicted  nucleic acid-binding Zn-ribbon protein
MRGRQSERQVGSIAGFQIFVADNFMQGPEIPLTRSTAYTAKATDTAHGTIRSVEHTIQHVEDLAVNLEQTIADTRKRLTDTKVQVEAPFEYAEELASLVQRQQEIEDALDLTKHQASGQLAANGTEDATSAEAEEPINLC